MSASPPEPHDSESAPAGLATRLKQRGQAAFAWVRSHPLPAVAASASAVITVAVIGAMIWWLGRPASDTRERLPGLGQILALLDGGDDVRAREAALAVRRSGLARPREQGTLAFVLGVVTAREAKALSGRARLRYELLAVKYLDEAYDLGLPPRREAEGLLQLGRSLHATGRYRRSEEMLRQALAKDPRRAAEIHFLLASVFLDDHDRPPADALAAIDAALAAADLAPPDRLQGMLRRCEILLRMGDLAQCRSTLDEIAPDAARDGEALLLRARIAMQEAAAGRGDVGPAPDPAAAAQAASQYQAAVDLLREAQVRARDPAATVPRAMYLMGLCYWEMGDLAAAIEQLERTRDRYYELPEGVAASFAAAELLRRIGRHDESLAAYRQTLELAGDPSSYANAWLPLARLQSQSLVAYQYFLETGQYATALALAEALASILPAARQQELVARCREAWGRWALQRAESLRGAEASQLAEEGHLQLRLAGAGYLRLGQERFVSQQYLEDLWRAAQSLVDGHDFTGAVVAFSEYLKIGSLANRPQALLGLGKALLAAGRIDESIVALRECIDLYPTQLAACEARLWAAQAYQEQHELAAAEGLLIENLNSELLTPAGREWRQSLFRLGVLLHDEGKYAEAIRRLEEAVARYPEAPESLQARYLIADAYVRSANQLLSKFSADVDDATRVTQGRQAAEYLQQAVTRFGSLQATLNHSSLDEQGDPQHRRLLRNSVFGLAQSLAALGRYDEAIAVYTRATNRYKRAPEVLEAYVQMADCYRRLHRLAEARSALEQAKVALKGFDAEVPFLETTNYSRDEWAARLDSLVELLNS